jgi:signal transduction histidine kinase
MMASGVGSHPRSDSPIELATVIEAAADRTTRLTGGRRPLLRLSQDLPPVRDPQSLQRVVENLVENAMQASRGESTVQVYAVRVDGCVTIHVIDEGEGMTQEIARQAFEPFYSRRGGSGLGLTVSRRIVERLGGSIELESTLGKGTRVTVRIPIEPIGT